MTKYYILYILIGLLLFSATANSRDIVGHLHYEYVTGDGVRVCSYRDKSGTHQHDIFTKISSACPVGVSLSLDLWNPGRIAPLGVISGIS